MTELPPLHPTNEQRMVDAIKAVEQILPGMAIAIIVAPTGAAPGRRANYIGNGARAEVRDLMAEMVARWDAGQ